MIARKKLLLIVLLTIACITVEGKKTFIPKYTSFIKIEHDGDSTVLEGDKSTLYANAETGMFRIAVIHETLTLQRIKYIKRMETATAFAAFSAVLSGVSSLSSDYEQRFRGRSQANVSGVLADIYNQNANAAKVLNIEIWVENTSHTEIRLSDAERGLVWYLRPGDIYKIPLPNPDMLQLRVSDLGHTDVCYICVGAGSILKDTNIEWENDNFWVFPILLRNEKGDLYAEEYVLIDKLTGERRKILKNELKAIKKDR